LANLQGFARKKWRALGYHVEAGEHITRVGPRVRRHDTFGFADLLCTRPGELILLQVTSWSNVSARVNKIARDSHGKGQWERPIFDTAIELLEIDGCRIIVEGWQKKNNRWQSREIEVTPLLLQGRQEKEGK